MKKIELRSEILKINIKLSKDQELNNSKYQSKLEVLKNLYQYKFKGKKQIKDANM